MEIPRQGMKTASSGLPDIQTNRILSFSEKSYPQISKPSSTNFIFSIIFGEGKKQFVGGGFRSRNCAIAVTNPKDYHKEKSY